MAYQIPLTIKDTLESIAQGKFVLPAIQRELVWAQEPERMTRLFDSILRGYPVGTFLFWKVTPEQSKTFHFYEFMLNWHERKHRHNDRLHLADPRELTAILDGQQRLTTLNIGLYGSLAHKLPRKRVDSIDAYPPKRLYVDLRYEPTEDDDLQFGFSFLTDEQARDRDGHHWYRVGGILDVVEPGEPIFEYVTENGLTSTPAFRTLSRLWKAVHEDGVVAYFEEKEQSLSKVLDIFVRVNSGGVVLTKSDLLLSIATAQFEGRDAREEIHGLVDDLNDTKPGFKFTKDLVLKAGLVLTDISDVGFRVENFSAKNMKILDDKWDDVERALRIGVKLLSSFGFSESSLPAASVLIPVADYIHQRGLDDNYVTSAAPSVRQDRALLRHWTIRTILKPGIWGSGLDQLLRSLHQALRDSTGGFPIDAIEAEMARRGKSLSFDGALLDELVDTPYKHKRSFALLTLLYDWVDTRNDFHVDHVFPRSLATAAKLRANGVPEADFAEFADKIERLSNLQLLAGPENLQKRAQLPADWVRSQYAGEEARNAWLAGHDLHGLPTDLVDFLPFYDRRRAVVRARLASLLGAGTEEIRESAVLTPALPPMPASEETAPPRVAVKHAAQADGSELAAGRRHYQTSLADLVASGIVSAGTVLHANYRGRDYRVTVTADGMLSDGTERYESPSQAARLLTGQKAVNGWAFWMTGDGTQIRELRT
ncbi:GmrSD restriction endonuclease domain-containing protein [Nocardioides antri]|uniref:DUF262 domain-containing protein n=1 Tax=Nocardioides antri TaxID=2607659 RepID=A0A5B1M396_9ACTN|nr:DUF262 domain-containing protein [Nocardioides antri]KAA1426888.1 DUF262 domain-containing protein [Nocardioides antri]